ncbi:hypothetical protein [Bartonella sp. HY038]|uniref:hypothetical protein n=1 Tax=Bartonella sp. HY038 TaxID=2759660 RepID=UPI0015F87FB5|nr:hypothetical protein [Bartonella sp. HY038]
MKYILYILIFLNIIFVSTAFAEEVIGGQHDVKVDVGYVKGHVAIYSCMSTTCRKRIILRPPCIVPVSNRQTDAKGDEWYEVSNFYCFSNLSISMSGYVQVKDIDIAEIKMFEPTIVPDLSFGKFPSIPHFQIRHCLEPQCPIAFDSQKDDIYQFLMDSSEVFEPEVKARKTCLLIVHDSPFIKKQSGGWMPISSSSCQIRQTDEYLFTSFIKFLEN